MSRDLSKGDKNAMGQDRMALYKRCRLCPRACAVDRTKGNPGFCQAPSELFISNYLVHRFEEPPISGTHGSGTIFFSYCTARCIYCQNYTYSRGKRGRRVSVEELARMMLELQHKSCHNINLVTPTHYVPGIICAIDLARRGGLKIPILYNCSGYETKETLEMLNGYIDIYLPDAKYSDDDLAKRHSGFTDYSVHAIEAIGRMHEQVGALETDAQGIAVKGLIVRHLVLPGHINNTEGVLRLLKDRIGTEVYISFMNQYSPTQGAMADPQLNKRLTAAEYETAKAYLHDLGFSNGWVQDQ